MLLLESSWDALSRFSLSLVPFGRPFTLKVTWYSVDHWAFRVLGEFARRVMLVEDVSELPAHPLKIRRVELP